MSESLPAEFTVSSTKAIHSHNSQLSLCTQPAGTQKTALTLHLVLSASAQDYKNYSHSDVGYY